MNKLSTLIVLAAVASLVLGCYASNHKDNPPSFEVGEPITVADGVAPALTMGSDHMFLGWTEIDMAEEVGQAVVSELNSDLVLESRLEISGEASLVNQLASSSSDIFFTFASNESPARFSVSRIGEDMAVTPLTTEIPSYISPIVCIHSICYSAYAVITESSPGVPESTQTHLIVFEGDDVTVMNLLYQENVGGFSPFLVAVDSSLHMCWSQFAGEFDGKSYCGEIEFMGTWAHPINLIYLELSESSFIRQMVPVEGGYIAVAMDFNKQWSMFNQVTGETTSLGSAQYLKMLTWDDLLITLRLADDALVMDELMSETVLKLADVSYDQLNTVDAVIQGDDLIITYQDGRAFDRDTCSINLIRVSK